MPGLLAQTLSSPITVPWVPASVACEAPPFFVCPKLPLRWQSRPFIFVLVRDQGTHTLTHTTPASRGKGMFLLAHNGPGTLVPPPWLCTGDPEGSPLFLQPELQGWQKSFTTLSLIQA